MMLRQQKMRMVPAKCGAVFALAVSLSSAGDVVGGPQRRDGDVVASEPEEYDEEAASTPGQQVKTIDEGLRGRRQLSDKKNRNRNKSRNRYNDVDVRTADGGGNEESFRLRLYWEDGYFWQESKDEMWWCMGEYLNVAPTFVPCEVVHCMCADPQPGDRILSFPECEECNGGDSIKIGWCGSTSRQQFTRVGSTFRPLSDQSLCMTSTGHSEDRPIRLYDCDDDDADQQFDGFHDDKRFEIHPTREPDRCVSNLHHPKMAEKVYPQPCHDTRSHETTYWIVY
jgi:hypothetical protein